MSGPVELQTRTVVAGRTWYLFGVDFDTADGKFSTYIYALSHDHAEMVVEEMKQTARVCGRIEGVIPWGGAA